MQDQLICSGCKRVLQYRRGATGVCCPSCSTFTAANPSGAQFVHCRCHCWHRNPLQFSQQKLTANDAFLQDQRCLNSSAAAASPCSCTTAAPPTFAARTAAGSTRQDQVRPPHCHPSKNHHLAGLELMMQTVTN